MGNGAVLNGSATMRGGTLTGDWSVALGGSLLLDTLGPIVIQANVANAGAIRKTGSGTVTIDGGAFNHGGSLDLLAGSLTLSNAARFINEGGTVTLADGVSIAHGTGANAVFVNDGLIQKLAGSGTATIGNSLGFSNSDRMDVRAGTIRLPDNFRNDGTLMGTGTFATTGTLTNAGVVLPGGDTIGMLTVSGNYAQTSTGKLFAQISTNGIGDLLSITGSSALGGTLSLSCLACSLTDTSEFRILRSLGGLSGSFATIDDRALQLTSDYAVRMRYDYAGGNVFASIYRTATSAVPEPATWGLMVIGFMIVGTSSRRHRRPTAI